MCKAIVRPVLIENLIEAKREIDSAKSKYDKIQAELIANMKSSKIKTDEVEGVGKVTIVSRKVLDTESISCNEEWVGLKAQESELSKLRKDIEKGFKVVSDTSFIKLTIK